MRIAVVPSTPLLLPGSVGLEDPIPALRAAVDAAVKWLDAPAVSLLFAPSSAADLARGVASPLGERIGRHLLGTVPVAAGSEAVLAIADGSARRTEKAPGHLDPRAEAFDQALETALCAGDGAALAALDLTLAEELWCSTGPVWRDLGPLLHGAEVTLDLADASFGVQYWVARCVS